MAAYYLPILAILTIAGCGGGEGGDTIRAPENPTLSLDASKWEFFYTEHTSGPDQAGPALTFEFPAEDGVHMLLTRFGGSLAGKSFITVVARIDAAPGTVFEGRDKCIGDAHAHVMAQKDGDDLTAQYGRWWSGRIPLVNGTVTLVLPLTPDKWSSVFGKLGDYRDKDEDVLPAFNDAFAHVGNIGITFGSCGNFAKGAWTNAGHARFTLEKFEVN